MMRMAIIGALMGGLAGSVFWPQSSTFRPWVWMCALAVSLFVFNAPNWN